MVFDRFQFHVQTDRYLGHSQSLFIAQEKDLLHCRGEILDDLVNQIEVFHMDDFQVNPVRVPGILFKNRPVPVFLAFPCSYKVQASISGSRKKIALERIK